MIEINMIDGVLDNIDGDNGPMKFYSIEIFDVMAIHRESILVPTDPNSYREAVEARNNEASENPFLQGQGSGVGYAIGGRRRRKKRTKKKRRKSRKKRRKKKTKRRK
jgi:hypothetical protein